MSCLPFARAAEYSLRPCSCIVANLSSVKPGRAHESWDQRLCALSDGRTGSGLTCCVDDECPLSQVDALPLGRLESNHEEHKEDEEVEVLEHGTDPRNLEPVVVQQGREVRVVDRDRFAFVVLEDRNMKSASAAAGSE